MSDKAMVHSGSASIPVEGGAGRFAELIARLEAAEVGSQEMDEAIHDAIGLTKERQCIAGLSDEVGGLWMYRFEGSAPQSAFCCTSSLDAALALAERVLVRVDYDAVDALSRALIELTIFGFRADKPIAPQLARALCIAILKALEAKV